MTIVLIILLLSSGCASTHHKYIRSSGKEIHEALKGLSDTETLEQGADLFNLRTDIRSEEIAKSLTIDEFIKWIKKRKSQVINESGILSLEYEKINIKKLSDDELVATIGILKSNADILSNKLKENLTKKEITMRLIYSTSMNIIAREMKRRDDAARGMSLFREAIITALSIAISAI